MAVFWAKDERCGKWSQWDHFFDSFRRKAFFLKCWQDVIGWCRVLNNGPLFYPWSLSKGRKNGLSKSIAKQKKCPGKFVLFKTSQLKIKYSISFSLEIDGVPLVKSLCRLHLKLKLSLVIDRFRLSLFFNILSNESLFWRDYVITFQRNCQKGNGISLSRWLAC